jgi:drug/metabolite transporter (DMT)-like permease
LEVSKSGKIPRSVIVGIVLAIILDTVIQIFWKMAVAGVPDDAGLIVTALSALKNPYFYLAMTAFAGQLFNWLRVLGEADLSFAQPFTALSYITVLTISTVTLHEHLTGPRIAGVLLIFAGVYLISRTSHNTSSKTLKDEGDVVQ